MEGVGNMQKTMKGYMKGVGGQHMARMVKKEGVRDLPKDHSG